MKKFVEPYYRPYIFSIQVCTLQKFCGMYFQQFTGHSVTIVGLEKSKNGSSNLLVLDPMFRPSPAMCLLITGHRNTPAEPEKLLKAYRRRGSCLGKYSRFELLK